MASEYYIEQGPPCGSGPSADAVTLHGPYKTFVDAARATDSVGTLLLRGHAPNKILRDRSGVRLEVWPGALDHLITL